MSFFSVYDEFDISPCFYRISQDNLHTYFFLFNLHLYSFPLLNIPTLDTIYAVTLYILYLI